jgi:ADP-ribose pyrophosphatase YjhB (NUDIX family)
MLEMISNGIVHSWFRLSRPMTLGARVVAINADGEICLIRHTYSPGWHLPGGGVERGETCRQAAIKEAREEAGLLIAPEDLKLASIHSNFKNMRGDHVTIYHARRWTLVPTDNAHEIAERGFFHPESLPPGTTAGTRNRIAEALGAPIIETW